MRPRIRVSSRLLRLSRARRSETLMSLLSVVLDGATQQEGQGPFPGDMSDIESVPDRRWYPHEDRPVVGFRPNGE